MLLQGLKPPHKALGALSRELCAQVPGAGQDTLHRGTQGQPRPDQDSSQLP